MQIQLSARHLLGALLLAAVPACSDTGTDGGSTVTPPPAPPAPPPPAPPPPPAAVPIQMIVSPTSRRASAQPDLPAPSDNAIITLTGDGSATAAWTASHRQPWVTLGAQGGSGGGTLSWSRSSAGLSPGMHVDTITIAAAGATGSPATILDSLQVTAASVPLALSVTPHSRNVTAVQGGTASNDNVAISLSGDGAATTQWTASRTASWATLTAGGGTGSGSLVWQRSLSGLPVGTFVDTLRITAPGATGSPVTVYDTLRVTAPPVPTTLAATPLSRSVTVTQGSSAPAATATVTITGDGATTISWTAGSRKSWTMLTSPVGVGSGTVAWARATSGLTAGTWVDTITVTAQVANGSPVRIIDTVVVTPVVGGGTTTPDLGLNADLHGLQVFPGSNLWNQPVDTAQVDPSSALILGAIGLTKGLHPDFGANDAGGPFGIPYIVVPDAQARYTLSFDYSGESDVGPYPIPANPPIEPGGGDSHLLVITQNEQKLYELYALSGGGATWHAGSGAIFDLIHGTTRPAGWTSADAAGLPIFPGLVRYDEVVQHGAINHALRFTVVHTRSAWIAPASHAASSSTNPLYAPMGMRVRLRASFDLSSYPPAAQVVLRALKKYGMIVADNGSDFFLSGTADARWNDDVNNTLKQVKVGDFEVIRMTGVVVP